MSLRPSRTWWKKKRWAAVLLLWLAVAYPFAVGPVRYALGRHWISYRFYSIMVAPIRNTFIPNSLRQRHAGYRIWWSNLASYHNHLDWERQRRAEAEAASKR